MLLVGFPTLEKCETEEYENKTNILEMAWERLCNSPLVELAAWLLHDEKDHLFPDTMFEAYSLLEEYIDAFPNKSIEDEEFLEGIRFELRFYKQLMEKKES